MIPRYSRPEMSAIWEAKTRFRIWFEIEAHACDALAEIGVIPKDAAKATRSRQLSAVMHNSLGGHYILYARMVFVCECIDSRREKWPRNLELVGVATRAFAPFEVTEYWLLIAVWSEWLIMKGPSLRLELAVVEHLDTNETNYGKAHERATKG